MEPREKVRKSVILTDLADENHADQVVASLNARNAYRGMRFEVNRVPSYGGESTFWRVFVFHLSRHSETVRKLQAWALGYLACLEEAEKAEAQADDTFTLTQN